MNALTYGLTGRTVLLPSEDPVAFERHSQEFLDEYKPEGATEKQVVQELIDTSWRLNRAPALEAELLSRAANPPTPEAAIEFDIVDAHMAIDRLALYSHRLSRQFHKTLEQLRDIQAERRDKQERDLKRAAGLLEMHKVKGIPYDPAVDGFVFSNDEVVLQPAFDPAEPVAPHRTPSLLRRPGPCAAVANAAALAGILEQHKLKAAI